MFAIPKTIQHILSNISAYSSISSDEEVVFYQYTKPGEQKYTNLDQTIFMFPFTRKQIEQDKDLKAVYEMHDKNGRAPLALRDECSDNQKQMLHSHLHDNKPIQAIVVGHGDSPYQGRFEGKPAELFVKTTPEVTYVDVPQLMRLINDYCGNALKDIIQSNRVQRFSLLSCRGAGENRSFSIEEGSILDQIIDQNQLSNVRFFDGATAPIKTSKSIPYFEEIPGKETARPSTLRIPINRTVKYDPIKNIIHTDKYYTEYQMAEYDRLSFSSSRNPDNLLFLQSLTMLILLVSGTMYIFCKRKKNSAQNINITSNNIHSGHKKKKKK